MSQRKAIIIGGGIAGPVAALFLQRAGIAAEIYEARSEAASYTGWFLNLAGNGIAILHTLGLATAIAAEGSPAPRMIIGNSQGKPLGEVRNGARAGLTESVLIRRSALQRGLSAAVVAAGIPLHFNRKLSKVATANGQGVVATFEDGTTATGDFLIGADGVHSQVRHLINPAAPQPVYTGLISTGGFTTGLDLPPTPKTQHFLFGKRAFFSYHVRADGEIYWFNNFGQPQEPGRRELSAIPSDTWQERLLAMHADDAPFLQSIIRATTSGIGAYPIYDIPPQPVWHRGAVVLLGDAVHAISPSSGQGASLAMEDAAILAKCLRDMPDLARAFATYAQLRRQRVERMVAWARKLGSTKVITNPFFVWLRDAMMPFFLPFAGNPAALDWIYNYDVAWEQ